MIQALTEGFRIATANDPNATTDVIALRLIDALETLMKSGAADKPDQEERLQVVEAMLLSRQRRNT
jgi:hypothetical protein